MAMADWLSSNIVVGPLGVRPRSAKSFLSQMDSCAALASATYSASAVESATHSCFLLLHDTAPPLIWNR